MSATREQWKVLQAIRALVESQMRPDLDGLTVQEYFLSQTPRDPRLGYVAIEYGGRHEKRQQITHIGIPLHGLVPEKAWPAAQWVIAQFRQVRPEWFV